jgi:hypothetical protein
LKTAKQIIPKYARFESNAMVLRKPGLRINEGMAVDANLECGLQLFFSDAFSLEESNALFAHFLQNSKVSICCQKNPKISSL